ncbi:hypothetical protein ACFWZ2_38750 [Streptomyces sp. NPDC059002]|uniref:hypothetical protein n=1 Tax=Streptomyces sp. NPDC059002 TaxID=3346690 RepID=UPI003679556D
MFDTFFGLPLHPLAVHAAAVLPLLAAAWSAATALLPRLGRRACAAGAVLAVATLASVFVADRSGREFATRLGNPSAAADHIALGKLTIWYALAFAVCAVGLWAVRVYEDRISLRGGVVVVRALTLLAAAALVVHAVRVGHSGATAVWGSV